MSTEHETEAGTLATKRVTRGEFLKLGGASVALATLAVPASPAAAQVGWSNWDQHGGPIASGPGCCSWGEGRLDIFALKSGQLGHIWYDRAWSNWELLGKPSSVSLTADPAAVSDAFGRIHVFARGTDGNLWHKWYARGRGWSNWDQHGDSLTSGPGCCSWGEGRLDVFVRSSGDTLWHIWYDRAWSDWEYLGGSLKSAPDAVSWGFGRIDVFARGTDDTLQHIWYARG
jgi:hypothetical protein